MIDWPTPMVPYGHDTETMRKVMTRTSLICIKIILSRFEERVFPQTGLQLTKYGYANEWYNDIRMPMSIFFLSFREIPAHFDNLLCVYTINIFHVKWASIYPRQNIVPHAHDCCVPDFEIRIPSGLVFTWKSYKGYLGCLTTAYCTSTFHIFPKGIVQHYTCLQCVIKHIRIIGREYNETIIRGSYLVFYIQLE